jgi:hypothetical protein
LNLSDLPSTPPDADPSDPLTNANNKMRELNDAVGCHDWPRAVSVARDVVVLVLSLMFAALRMSGK